jgi:exonuclease VII small subunit
MYKPLDDETREKCIALLRSAVALAQQANTLLEIAGGAVQGVLTALEAKDETESEQQ